MSSGFVASTLVLLVTATGCESPSPIVPVEPAPQMSFSNGPDVLPNVLRYDGEQVLVIVDEETDLIAFAGVPGIRFDCDGVVPPMIPVQDAGQLQGIIHRLVNARDVTVAVYRLSTIEGPCATQPIARGIGHVTSTDNDLTGSGTRTNSWGSHIRGSVTILETGDTQRLNAHVRYRFGGGGRSAGNHTSVVLH